MEGGERTVGALIVSVDECSPAERAGIAAGEEVCSVDGQPVRDILDWQWLTACDGCAVELQDGEGHRRIVSLERAFDEPWGLSFSDIVFDGVRSCCNACTFCFMRQLPKGLRRTLYLRDDDFRLSFLQGNFVTLTNLDEEDVARICEERISPLRMSLHAADPSVRAALMGERADRGLRNAEALLRAGIQLDAQIVLVPGVNDGRVLDETLTWAWEREGIQAVGIVPLGYTKHQDAFHESFNEPARARGVLAQIAPYQERAQAERGDAWVYAADEFYLNAFGGEVLRRLPSEEFYGDYPLFEDGIGIVRSTVDDFAEAQKTGLDAQAARALEEAGLEAALLLGCAPKPYASALISQSALSGQVRALFVPNELFSGNVDVTGLLGGEDMVRAVREDAARRALREDAERGVRRLYLLPQVAFNADGVTLDGLSAEDIRAACGQEVQVAPSNPLDCMQHMIRYAEKR